MHNIPSFRSNSHTLLRQRHGEKKLNRMDRVNCILMIAVIALFALTIVMLGLSQAGYFHPAFPLIAFSPIIPLFVLAGVLDCCRDSVANRHGINLVARDNIRLRRHPQNSS